MTENDASEFKQLSFDEMAGGEVPDAQELAEIEATQEKASGLALASFSSAPAMDAEDVFIPRLRLAQGLTSEVQSGEAKPGQWIVTGYPAADELTIVPLMFNRHRELTDDDFKVLCKSTDAMVGVGVPGGDCSACPMNQWMDGTKGKRIPPKCTFAYAYIVYVVETHSIAMVDFKRTSIQAGKTLNTMTIQRGLGNFAAILRSGSKSGTKGAYYTATVSPSVVSAETLALAKQMVS